MTPVLCFYFSLLQIGTCVFCPGWPHPITFLSSPLK
jgi:hypothetical protein